VRAIVVSRFGPPEVLVPTDVPEPTAGAGEVVIDVEVANITFVETQIRAGRSPNPAMAPALPLIPGNGVGGVVAVAGAGVDPALVGRRVVSTTGGSGAYAEQVVVGAGQLISVPDGVTTDDAVALLADGRTAIALVRAAALASGDTVLVEAAAGGVGSLLVQLARSAGARVLGAAGGDRKRAAARDLGAEWTVDYRDAGWTDEARRLSGGVDVGFDGVGGDIGRAGLDLVRPGGRFVAFGMASGAFTVVDEADAAARGIRLVRLPALAPDESRSLTEAALFEAGGGRLHALIGQRYPLDQATEAHTAIEARATIGKTLLTVR
jgi:NADPH:quinone reductase